MTPFLPMSSNVASLELRFVQLLPLYSHTPVPAKSATTVLVFESVSTVAFRVSICDQVVPFQNQTPTGAPLSANVATALLLALEARTTGL